VIETRPTTERLVGLRAQWLRSRTIPLAFVPPLANTLVRALGLEPKDRRIKSALTEDLRAKRCGMLFHLEFGSASGARPILQVPARSGFGVDAGGSGGTRTHDPRFRRPMLYPLSYAPVLFECRRAGSVGPALDSDRSSRFSSRSSAGICLASRPLTSGAKTRIGPDGRISIESAT
jgi:hypothetical protein